MSVYVCCETRWEAAVHRYHKSVSLRQRQVWTKLIFSWFVCLKNDILRCVSVKNGSNVYLGDDGVKELVIICDHVHFFSKNEWTQDCFLSPKGAGPWPKTMWHWYRKWTVSETSRFLLTVSGTDLCWRPWDCLWHSFPECLHTHRRCLPRQQSCVWGFWGPHPQFSSTPTSEILWKNDNTITMLFGLFCPHLRRKQQKQQENINKSQSRFVLSSTHSNILTDIKAIDSWETLCVAGAGRSTKQIQLSFHNTQKETRQYAFFIYGKSLTAESTSLHSFQLVWFYGPKTAKSDVSWKNIDRKLAG